jgi:hypothetical protein
MLEVLIFAAVVASGGSSASAAAMAPAGVQESGREGAVHAAMLGGLIYPSASLLRTEGRETLGGTTR